MNKIEISWQDLMRQAPITVGRYLSEVEAMLDARFGPGYAAKNPALVGQLVATCATDYHSAAISVAAQTVAEELASIGDALQLGAQG